jgi:hypothetical protein
MTAAEEYPTPLLVTLTEPQRVSVIRDAGEAIERLTAGEPIAALTYEQVFALVALKEAELAAFVTELQRRRLAMNN